MWKRKANKAKKVNIIENSEIGSMLGVARIIGETDKN